MTVHLLFHYAPGSDDAYCCTALCFPLGEEKRIVAKSSSYTSAKEAALVGVRHLLESAPELREPPPYESVEV